MLHAPARVRASIELFYGAVCARYLGISVCAILLAVKGKRSEKIVDEAGHGFVFEVDELFGASFFSLDRDRAIFIFVRPHWERSM